MPAQWCLVAYQTPAEPSTARVSAWRGLHRLGGLYLGPTVCLLPARLADQGQLEAIGARVRAAGGAFDVLEIESFAPDAEALIRGRYNEARAAEYAEIVERAAAVVAELDRESTRDKFTFAEVEENEADLTKLRRWLRRVAGRDLFECGARDGADAAVKGTEARLATFVEVAIAREAGAADDGASSSDQPSLRVVRGSDQSARG